MKKKLVAVFVALAFATAGFGLDITTRSGMTYRKCEVEKVESDGIRVSHDTGAAKIAFEDLPDALRRKYGFDPAKVAAYRKGIAEAKAAAEAKATLEKLQADAARQKQVKTAKLVAEQKTVLQNAAATTPEVERSQKDESKAIDTTTAPDAPTQIAQRVLLEHPIMSACAALLTLIIAVRTISGISKRHHRAHLLAEARRFLSGVAANDSFPPVSTQVLLRAGEVAIYDEPSTLFEKRAVRDYVSGRVGLRIAKGVWIGGSRGRSVSSQEWSKLSTGTLTLTNKRLVFNGDGVDRTVAREKIISVEAWSDAVEVSVENRQKSMVFSAANPFIAHALIALIGSPPPSLLKT